MLIIAAESIANKQLDGVSVVVYFIKKDLKLKEISVTCKKT
jgi:hypothetical protein